MAKHLAQLRRNLDVFPSGDPSQPGIVLRDTFGFAGEMLLVPYGLLPVLRLLDGQPAGADTPDDATVSRVAEALSAAGFLEDEAFEALRHEKTEAFRRQTFIPASHFGPGNYPADPGELEALFGRWIPPGEPAAPIRAIAAPHASPGAAQSVYAAAYRALASALPPAAAKEKTFVILGTSHYGAPDRFGITRKTFRTPIGDAVTDGKLVERLAEKAQLEDYCFAIEHSIEFQIVFLQYLYGPDVRILPILCGAFADSLLRGGLPENMEANRRMFSELGELASREGDRLVWVLGIDMAHIGKRYGGSHPVEAYQGEMQLVQVGDENRIAAMERSDSEGFWSLVRPERDPLQWCGSSPVYTFLKAMPGLRGERLGYGHWQIDPQSVVTFGAMQFR